MYSPCQQVVLPTSSLINNMVSQLLQHVHFHFNLFIVLPAFSFHWLSQKFSQQWVIAVNAQTFMLKPHGERNSLEILIVGAKMRMFVSSQLNIYSS